MVVGYPVSVISGLPDDIGEGGWHRFNDVRQAVFLAQGLNKRRHLVVVVPRHHRKEAEKNAN